ncbi:MAG: hypothetical protein QHG99_00525 [Methanomicrobiales archaeon]|nr:hypothetical protein [Methanomicrobiales archaeon]
MIRRAVLGAAAMYAIVMLIQASQAPLVMNQAIAAALTVIIAAGAYILSKRDLVEHLEILILWICILLFAVYACAVYAIATFGGGA